MTGELIARVLERRASWRVELMHEQPDDIRPRRSYEALRALALYVRTLPADDQRLHELCTLCKIASVGEFAAGPIVDYLITDYGFQRPPEDPDAFLSSLVPAATRDAINLGIDLGAIDVPGVPEDEL